VEDEGSDASSTMVSRQSARSKKNPRPSVNRSAGCELGRTGIFQTRADDGSLPPIRSPAMSAPLNPVMPSLPPGRGRPPPARQPPCLRRPAPTPAALPERLTT